MTAKAEVKSLCLNTCLNCKIIFLRTEMKVNVDWVLFSWNWIWKKRIKLFQQNWTMMKRLVIWTITGAGQDSLAPSRRESNCTSTMEATVVPWIFKNALHAAVQSNAVDVLALLLDIGVDPNRTGTGSSTDTTVACVTAWLWLRINDDRVTE